MFDVATVVNESRSSPSAIHILKQELNVLICFCNIIEMFIFNRRYSSINK